MSYKWKPILPLSEEDQKIDLSEVASLKVAVIREKALWDGPRAFIFFGPEWSAGVNQKDLGSRVVYTVQPANESLFSFSPVL